MLRSLIFFASVVLVTACKSTAPDSTPPATASFTPPTSAPSAEEHHHELNLPAPKPTITVTLDGNDVDVPLASLPRGGASPFLLDVVKFAFPKVELTPYTFDVFGSDGFHPSQKPPCAAPMTAAFLAPAHVDATTHDVSFDGDAKLPGCYRVKGVAKIVATH